jgi:imidazolonepropionase-like amidohydrolase
VVWHPAKGIPAYRNIPREDFDRCRVSLQRKRQLAKLLHSDGVPLLLGTDTQQPFAAPGIALHREFREFDEAGIPRRHSFRLATQTAAKTLGITDMGTIREGARADLMVSRTDPHQSSWSAQRDLVATIARGAFMTAADLDQAIRKELARFEHRFGDYTSRLLAQITMNRLAKNFVG